MGCWPLRMHAVLHLRSRVLGSGSSLQCCAGTVPCHESRQDNAQASHGQLSAVAQQSTDQTVIRGSGCQLLLSHSVLLQVISTSGYQGLYRGLQPALVGTAVSQGKACGTIQCLITWKSNSHPTVLRQMKDRWRPDWPPCLPLSGCREPLLADTATSAAAARAVLVQA